MIASEPRLTISVASPIPVPATPLVTDKPSAITWRSAGVALFMAAVFGYCIPIVDFKFSNTFLGAMHMPAGAVAVLIALLLIVNPLLRLLSSRAAFTRNEVLTVYITCLFSALVPGKGSETFFIPNILSSFYYATRENKWLEYLQPLTSWMTPAVGANGKFNIGAVNDWYNGLPVGAPIPWGVWLIPLIAWGLLIFALQTMHSCLAVILRAQWAEREALAFPLLRLPLELTEGGETSRGRWGSVLRDPLLWCGVGISVFIEMVNGLSFYYSSVPSIPLSLNTAPYLTEAPWNQTGGLQVQIFPAILGISFLLTREVSFSLWFFFLFAKFQLIVAYYLGFQPNTLETPFWTRGWAKGFIGYQQVGAILGYVLVLQWIGREHWKYVVRRALGRVPARPSEKQEAFSYPVAFWGFVISLGVIIAWTVASGVPLTVALLLWAFYIAIAMTLTRLVVEAGLLFVHSGWMPIGPLAFLIGAGPGHLINATNAAQTSVLSCSFMLDMRGFLLPSFLQSFKLAHDRKIAVRPLLGLIAACIVVSFSIGVWKIITLGYTESGLKLQNWWVTAAGSQPAQHAVGLSRGIETNYVVNWFWLSVGVLATWGMMAARSRFLWFPFHPIGLVMCVPFAIHSMWVSIMLGWTCKVLVTRYGGNETYRRVTPAFLGLALGDVIMIVFWILVDGWQGRTGHALLPF